MKLAHLSLAFALVAGCYRQKADDTSQRLATIEQRLDAQDKAIAALAQRPDTTELAALAGQLTDLQGKLAEILDSVKTAKAPARQPRREPDENAVYSVPIGKSPAVGSPAAKVTMVMAMDFDCPFCRKAWDTVEQLRTRYPKDLRVVYKAFVVHPRTAMLPAQAACAASKQGKFRELAQLIWTKAYDARGTEKEPFGADHLRALAGEAKLDLARYDQDIAGACVNEVRDDMASMTKLGVNATPTFYINGRYKSGAMPIEQFAALIDEEMAKANAAIQRGVKPEQYYQQEVVAKGQAALAQP